MNRYIPTVILVLSLGACTTLPAVFTDIASGLNTVARGASAVASATTGAVSSVASTVSGAATTAADATPTVQALVTDVQGIVNGAGLSGTDLSNATADLTKLEGIAATVTPASSGAQLSSTFGSINGVLSELSTILPAVAPLLSMTQNEGGEPGWVTADSDPGFALMATTVTHVDPAKLADLQKRLATLKAIAAAKVAAGK